MSVGIVRVEKFGVGSVKGIEIHDRRTKFGVSHTNPDIDWERSNQNYDLHPAQNQNFNRAVKERIVSLRLSKAVRKDAVVMAQVLVTSDHDFFKGLSKGQQERFFKDSYEFLKDRYGEKNIISATVHLDERTPHMHCNFVPVTEDGRLSAKSILTRQSLLEQQDKFQACVGQKYGLRRGMTKEERIKKGVQRKNFTVPEYKALTAEIQRKETELAELTETVLNARKSALRARDEGKATERGLTASKEVGWWFQEFKDSETEKRKEKELDRVYKSINKALEKLPLEAAKCFIKAFNVSNEQGRHLKMRSGFFAEGDPEEVRPRSYDR